MKLVDIVNTVAKELGTSDLNEINKLLKAEPAVKFRMTGKALGHFGFTGQIKSLSEEGVKAFMANKVSLIRLADIETFEKAKPREDRSARPVKTEAKEKVKPDSPAVVKSAVKKSKPPVKVAKPEVEEDEDFEDGNDDFDDLRPKKLMKSKAKVVGKNGSKFIPTAKKNSK